MTEGENSGVVGMVEILPRSLHSGPQTMRASGRDDKDGDILPRWGRAVLDHYANQPPRKNKPKSTVKGDCATAMKT
jgi:hypothetical protein